MRKRNYILAVILLMIIGYASISTIFSIIGGTRVAENASDFDVYFSKASINGIEHNELISSDGKNINFGINELKDKGEELILAYEITNSSSQYDADINLLLDSLSTNEYINIKKEDNFNGVIGAGDKGKGTITITLIKPVTESEDINLDLNIGIDALEKELGSHSGSYTPNNPKPDDYTLNATLTDKEGNVLKDKVTVIVSGNKVEYTKTDLEGNICQDNLPQGTIDLYIFDRKELEEVKHMTLSEVKEKADRHIRITTSTTGNQKGDEVDAKNVSTTKTESIEIIEIKIEDTTIKKKVGEDNEVIFNIDTNEKEVELPGIGKQEIKPGENRFEIPLENGETITVIVNNILPTPPSITGGSDKFVKTDEVTINLADKGTSLSDIDYYEYIISDTKITDFSNVLPTGTTSDLVTIDTEGTKYVYYRAVSKNNTKSEWSNEVVVKLDKSNPEVIVRSTTSSSNSININFEATDKYSGIKEITCQYGEEDYTTTGKLEGTSCKLTGLKNNTIYKYKICATDNVENETCKTGEAGTNEIKNPVIGFDNNESASGEYYLGQTAKVSFDGTGIESPKYYIKSTRKGISNINVTKSCGSDTTPGECTDITPTTIVSKDVWYEVPGNINITYSEASDEYSKIIALVYDGYNYSAKTTGTIGKIAYAAVDLSYTNSLAPNVTNVQEALDDLYRRLK